MLKIVADDAVDSTETWEAQLVHDCLRRSPSAEEADDSFKRDAGTGDHKIATAFRGGSDGHWIHAGA